LDWLSWIETLKKILAERNTVRAARQVDLCFLTAMQFRVSLRSNDVAQYATIK
jgi:hypothetical protein